MCVCAGGGGGGGGVVFGRLSIFSCVPDSLVRRESGQTVYYVLC